MTPSPRGGEGVYVREGGPMRTSAPTKIMLLRRVSRADHIRPYSYLITPNSYLITPNS